MKLSYYDAFDILSEDAGKLLASLESQAVNADKYSSKITREEVLKKVRKPKSVSGKRIRLRLLIAAILILSLSGVAFAASHYDLFRDGRRSDHRRKPGSGRQRNGDDGFRV